jgi:hypothetical protein
MISLSILQKMGEEVGGKGERQRGVSGGVCVCVCVCVLGEASEDGKREKG